MGGRQVAWTAISCAEAMAATATADSYNRDVTGHVFVSYLRDDAEVVDRLVADLRARGLTVWLDRDSIDAGQRWKSSIHRAIRSGHLFIACFSRNYLSRAKSYMNEELIVAIEELRQRPKDRSWFIPVSVDGTDIPYIEIGAGETLHDLQRLDVSEGGGKAAEMIARAAASSHEALSASLSKLGRQDLVDTSGANTIFDKLSEIDARRTAEAEWEAFIWSGESVPVAHAELKSLYAKVQTLGEQVRARTRSIKLEVEIASPSCAVRLGRHTVVLSWLAHAANFVARSKLYVLDYDQLYYLSGGNISVPEPPVVAKYDFALVSQHYGWRSGDTFMTSEGLAHWCVERLISHIESGR